jgi:predicted DNA-binding transcriptional regulator AlpA
LSDKPKRILPFPFWCRDRAGFSPATGYRLRETDPTFPQLYQISEHRVGIDEDEGAAWLNARPLAGGNRAGPGRPRKVVAA